MSNNITETILTVSVFTGDFFLEKKKKKPE